MPTEDVTLESSAHTLAEGLSAVTLHAVPRTRKASKAIVATMANNSFAIALSVLFLATSSAAISRKVKGK